MASASVGARVVTINYTINFIKNLHAGDVATAVGTVIHRGHKTIIINVETFNKEGTLLTEMTGTMYVIGQFENIPEKASLKTYPKNGKLVLMVQSYEKDFKTHHFYSSISCQPCRCRDIHEYAFLIFY